MKRFWIIAAMTAVGTFLVGCGGQAGEGPSEHRARDHTTMHKDPSGSTKPPQSTLSFEDQAVTGVLGSFCWQSGTVGGCFDAASVPVPDEEKTLSVPAGSVMVFDYGGKSLNSAGAAAYPLGRGEQVGEEARTLRTLRRGERTEILAGVSAGEYVVDVFVTVSEGDASYYFRVAVEEDERKLPDPGGPGY
jgi:hypothetical protein